MREREAQGFERARRRAPREGGFTVIQMVITLAVLAIAATFAFMGIASARTAMRVQSSAREFASYVEKARSDAIRRHATATVQITTANATSYVVTMDFNLDGVTESRTITLEEGVYINHNATSLTFDWRGRLTGDGLSLSFAGPDGVYPVQLDVTGSGDVTIGEEKFLDSEVPTVTLNNGGAGGDVLNDVSALPPTIIAPPSNPPSPPSEPPGTTPPPSPPSEPPGTTPPATEPPSTPPSEPPGNGNDKDKKNDEPPSPPPSEPPSTPPSEPPSTPPSGSTCTIAADPSSTLTVNACNGAGKFCGSGSIKITLTNASSGTTVSVSGVPNHLSSAGPVQSGNDFTFTFTAKNNTRTTNDLTFTATACGTKTVAVKTN